jgi:hypothetical protein
MRFALRAFALAPVALAALALGEASGCGRTTFPDAPDDGGSGDVAVEHVRVPYDGLPSPGTGTATPVHAEFLSRRVDTMNLMFAAGEMQTSGEPFAQNFAGRNLFDYSRYALPPNLYTVPASGKNQGFAQSTIDLFGFSTAVESYEYSKYHMNMVANQTGAGVSLANGPLVAQLPGSSPFDKLRTRVGQLIAASGANVAAQSTSPDSGAFAVLPPPSDNGTNDFGFPGLWPNLYPYRSFDPTMTPGTGIVHSCTSVTGYGGIAQYGGMPVNTYECNYNLLRLNDRLAQSELVIGPGTLGFTTWKEAIWAIDFTGRLHDSIANPVTAVGPTDMALVGQAGNMVVAVEPPSSRPGVFIGSTPLEGMWGLMMVDELDNAGAWLLSSLLTGDGATLSGVPSVAAAIQYDYGSPLLWMPTAIAVTEDGNGRYPGVSSLTLTDASSQAVDLAAILQGYSLFFGMTDARNAAVGQQLGLQVAFGGYPFASDDGQPDGENTPHDRALAVMRLAFVDLDRIHADPATGILVDSATIAGANVTRGTTASTTSLGHEVVGLRHLLMACNAAVSQYGAPDGDATKDAAGILNSVPLHPGGSADAGASVLFSPRVRQVLMNQATFVRDVLTQADGTVANGATLSGGTWSPSTDATTLESQSAALRVLVEAWFLSHDMTFYARAQAVASALLGPAFWSANARMFRGQSGGADDVVMTPDRFAWLQQALRETYEALWIPGDPLLDRSVLEDRMGRANKLYLNGWDDTNGDGLVNAPGECLDARLQMGEQALTGEVGTPNNSFDNNSGPDREPDCVPNIASANVGSVLAGQVHFHAP